MLASLLTMAAAAAVVRAQDKPTINPGFDFQGRMETDLRNHLSPTHSVWDYWGSGWIPQGCKDWAHDHGQNPWDFTVFNVHYDDCSEPWIFCRHKDTQSSEIDMIDIFGRMPVHMRSYVRQFIGSPNVDGYAAWSYGSGDVVVEYPIGIWMLAHEFSHQMDWHALPQYNQQFSDTQVWRENFNQDDAVPSDYSRSNFAEDFAEVGVVSLYDRVVPGGIGSINPNWHVIYHQYATYEGYLGDNATPGGTCRNRIGNSAPVPMSNSKRANMGDMPDVSFKSNITVIDVKAETATFAIPHDTEHTH